MIDLIALAQAAKAASRILAKASAGAKNEAIEAMACALEEATQEILGANHEDVAQAEKAVERGELSKQLLGRLVLSPQKMKQMVAGLRAVGELADPANRVALRNLLDDGLELHKVTCPFGVLAAVIEARPDAVVQLAGLAIKSGNAILIKAGSEAKQTTEKILSVLRLALRSSTRIPEDALTCVADREAVKTLLTLNDYVDLIIPRGSNELVRYVQSNTSIPVLGHADGVCHIYVDREADIEQALAIIIDSKVQSPTACNSVETVLVHADIAAKFLPELVDRLKAKRVEVRACERTRAFLAGRDIAPVNDWHTEYGDLVLAIRVVNNISEAIEHINRFGSGHTDAIVTRDPMASQQFMDEVDSAGVYVNASTRFADGYRYGFGAEVGISTNKLHARGPVGLDGLVTYKYKLYGHGHIVVDYASGDRTFKHETRISADHAISAD